jgi:hypothetical protein
MFGKNLLPSGTAALLLSLSPLSAQLAGWAWHKNITINTSSSGANVPGKVDKYPLAVSLTSANFNFAQAKDDGSDLRFTKSDGSPLPYEIEMWDKAAQKAAVWVKVDVQGSSASQSIAMHWGNPGATSASAPKAVFDTADGYLGVWHLGEAGNTDAGGYKDATANQAHGTGVNTKPANTVDGVAGKAHLNSNKDKTWIKVADPKDLFNYSPNTLTLSVWTNVTAWPAGTYQNVMSKGDVSWTVQRDGAGKDFEHCTAANPYHICSVSGAEAAPGTWHQITALWSWQNYVSMGFDGKISDRTDSKPDWKEWKVGHDPVGIGNQGRASGAEVSRWWDGILDEARVMKGLKDANWMLLDWETQKPGAKTLVFGEATGTFIRRTLPGYLPAGKSDLRVFDLQGRLLSPLSRSATFEIPSVKKDLNENH